MKKYYREILETSNGLKLSEPIEHSTNNMPLCSSCKVHGYCVAKFYKDPHTNKLIPIPENESSRERLTISDIKRPITDKEVSKIVNLRTEYNAGTKLVKKLQKAHDLFHQDEFEQASYMYLDIIETRNDSTEAWRGICASFYFLGKYEEAATACMNTNTGLGSWFTNRFIRACEAKMKEHEEKKNIGTEEKNFSAAEIKINQPISQQV